MNEKSLRELHLVVKTIVVSKISWAGSSLGGRPLIYILMWSRGGKVYAADLKSAGPNGSCEFESHRDYKLVDILR